MKSKQSALKKLTAFTNETKIVIGGCGCCGSPWLRKADGSGHYISDGDSDLEWVGKTQIMDAEDKVKSLRDQITQCMTNLRNLPMDNNVSYLLDELELAHMELFEAIDKLNVDLD